MKEFFKFVFASMIGVVLAFFAILVILSVIIAGMISSTSKEEVAAVSANSVMHVELNYPINERTAKNPLNKFFPLDIEGSENLGLNDLLGNIRKAKLDDNIKVFTSTSPVFKLDMQLSKKSEMH